ncbi:DUF4190 domain-containing protein [Actinomyces vulturis]|uniref:DUF4190 domain-containing protein n=1 Tax=Actinomyces vulturis TaxID=1857645 RepID=UPI0008321C53|nr:DUF4190 domain-containing protein [Actinomyces vulturis]
MNDNYPSSSNGWLPHNTPSPDDPTVVVPQHQETVSGSGYFDPGNGQASPADPYRTGTYDRGTNVSPTTYPGYEGMGSPMPPVPPYDAQAGQGYSAPAYLGQPNAGAQGTFQGMNNQQYPATGQSFPTHPAATAYPQQPQVNLGYPTRTSTQKDWMGIVSLVLGFLSLLCCGSLLITEVVGLILGILGHQACNKGEASNEGVTLGGLILNAVVLTGGIILLIVRVALGSTFFFMY